MAVQQLIGVELADRVGAAVPDSVEGMVDGVLWVKAPKIADVAAFMKSDAGLDFNFLNSISAVDTGADLIGQFHADQLLNGHLGVLLVGAAAERVQVGAVGQVAGLLDLLVKFHDSVQGMAGGVLWVNAPKIADVASFMKSDSGLDFNFLNSISAVDYIDHFEVVYHLTSLTKQHTAIFMKLAPPAAVPTTVPTAWCPALTT